MKTKGSEMTTPNEELIVRLQNYDWAHDHDCVNDAAIVLQSQAERIKELQQELHALGEQHVKFILGAHSVVCTERDALRAELDALRGQEPVAYLCERESGNFDVLTDQTCKKCFPVFAAPVAPAQPAQSSVAFSDRVVEIFLAVNGPASSGVMDSLRLAAAHAYSQPAQGERVEVDWQDQYWKQKRRAEMWIAKYEKDIGPLEKAHPVAANPAQDVNVERCCQHDSDCTGNEINVYTADQLKKALRDVLEQAANICSKRGNILSTNPDIYRDAQECAKEIRAMKGRIK